MKKTIMGAALLATLSAGVARAELLFVPAESQPAYRAAGITGVQTLTLDVAALASIRASSQATLTDFPLATDGVVTLSLERFEPFTANAQAVVMESAGPRALALPDRRYFRGKVDGDPTSIAVLVAGTDTARGFVSTAGTVYRFGRDRTAVHRSWALRNADPTLYPGPGDFCGNAKYPALVNRSSGRVATLSGAEALSASVRSFSPTLLVEVAIDTDEELIAHFDNVAETLDYLADLAAAQSAIFSADTNVRIKFSFIRLWRTTDPWSNTIDGHPVSQDTAFTELVAYWEANEGSTPRDLVHLVAGKGLGGGLGTLGGLCVDGFAVSSVYGSFDVMDPNETWDVLVVAHELGHNFGAHHTHCYDPPLDHCFLEPGCYEGPTSLPPGGGTIMSYCGQLPGGLANVNLTFGDAISGIVRASAENGICVGPPCGDGLVDPGEDCDDGNNADGDCCSANCLAESDGNACDPSGICMDNGQCSSGVCVGTPAADGTSCDDGSQCTTDGCLSGACVGTPALAVGCKLPGTSQFLLKDKTPDKGDQVSWKWKKGEATTIAEFGEPTSTATSVDDYELCVYGPGPSLLFSGKFPAGFRCSETVGIHLGDPCWKEMAGKGFSYKDKELTPNGMEKLSLKAGGNGAASVSAKGKDSKLNMPVLGSLALPITTQLRRAGSCWEATYSTPAVNTAEQFAAKSE